MNLSSLDRQRPRIVITLRHVSRSDALRDLYEALEMLDAQQQGRARPEPVDEVVIDLRQDATPVAPSASAVPATRQPRSGADWEPRGLRW